MFKRILVIATLVTLATCGDESSSDLGKVCESNADCADTLECDVHTGDTEGTCQEPHSHE